ncbi:probable disease resistance protein At5g66910 [Lactuca sativa]|uniref:RPW8 domain-containing protein n=1 Tax=Lactuca sativa TaxID=4236 RepID=A0A9R1WFY0_LACSA|nr:probable disease resistance protein At5g66910 [Lactuca sativa]KAJ0222102.1 hypothetical protein LSAT_V11C200074840 [Lactuca sativa]
MAVVFQNALQFVLGELQKAVDVIGQIVQAARFKRLLKRLENTLKSIELVFYESWRLSKVLDRSEKETIKFISYLRNATEIVLKCSSIKYRTMNKKILHSSKLIRLNNELLRFFQIDVQEKTMNTNMTYSIAISGLEDNSSVVAFSADGYSSTCSVYAGQLLNLPLTDSFANLTSIRFEHVSFSSSIQPLFILPFLQKLSFVMCEIGDAFKNSVTDQSPYIPSNLIDLEFDCCYDLRELPSGVCNLVHLQNLSITNCHELDALPKNLGNLSNLQILNFHCCTKLQELPESIGRLHNLSFLDLSDCLSISLLPDEIGELCSLRVVKMSGVHGLPELPESMSKLLQLEEVICDEETSYLWMDYESDLNNLTINVVEDDRFESFMKIVE